MRFLSIFLASAEIWYAKTHGLPKRLGFSIFPFFTINFIQWKQTQQQIFFNLIKNKMEPHIVAQLDYLMEQVKVLKIRYNI